MQIVSIGMSIKCQTPFSGKNKKNVINFLSAELAQRAVKVILEQVTRGSCISQPAASPKLMQNFKDYRLSSDLYPSVVTLTTNQQFQMKKFRNTILTQCIYMGNGKEPYFILQQNHWVEKQRVKSLLFMTIHITHCFLAIDSVMSFSGFR